MNLPPPFEHHDRLNETETRSRISRAFDTLAADLPFRTLVATATWNPANTADGAVASVVMDCLGARIGDPVSVGFSSNVAGNDLVWSGYVQAADKVRVVMLNKQGVAVDLASGTVTVMVFQAR